jgi:hypothetical protein
MKSPAQPAAASGQTFLFASEPPEVGERLAESSQAAKAGVVRHCMQTTDADSRREPGDQTRWQCGHVNETDMASSSEVTCCKE